MAALFRWRMVSSRTTMARCPILLALLTLSVSAPACVAATGTSRDFARFPEVRTITAGQPADVTSFVERTAECLHWAGEDPYDSERAEFIRQAVERARCDELEGDEATLRNTYRNNPGV